MSLQASDGELRRLSEQLLQKDEVLLKLQREKEHLVELSQVRAGQWEERDVVVTSMIRRMRE